MKKSSNDKTFPEYLDKFEKMQAFIINDLRKSCIQAQTNFLTAMGIFNYIETLGAFGVKKGSPNGDKFEYTFKNLFSQDYKDKYTTIEKDLKNAEVGRSKPVYDCLRCGMTHEYFIKTYKNLRIKYTIEGVKNEPKYDVCLNDIKCGIEYKKLTHNLSHIKIFNPKFINDLDSAFDKLRNKVINDIDSKDIRKYFISRCKDINILEFD